MRYLLDTHTFIWLNSRPAELSRKVRDVLESLSGEDELLLSAFSLWEICKLVEKKRLELYEDTEVWIKEALQVPRLRLCPLDLQVFLKSTTLPGDFHNDPADQIIVATARLNDASILTRDKLIQRYSYVKTIW